MDITQLTTKMMPSRTEQQTERQGTPSGGGSGGSWRRRSLVATVVLALGVYLRRRRSGTAETTVADGGTETGETVDHESPDAGSRARRLGRRLVMMAISTLAITLARRALRRFRSAR